MLLKLFGYHRRVTACGQSRPPHLAAAAAAAVIV
jgi:hypothetical protein